MKKVLLLLLCACITISFCSCSDTVELHGLDEFSPANSSIDLCWRLLPSSSFVDDFDYLDGDYEYRYYQKFGGDWYSKEHALMYLIYDESNYLLAKEYTLENTALSSINVFSYNGYQFYENLNFHTLGAYYHRENEDFPYWFNMIAYNDEKCTLVFFGLYVGCPREEDKEVLESDDMILILKTYFSCYDFDA